MITKIVEITLTREEIDSPEPIELVVSVHSEDDIEKDSGVSYTITYPKTPKKNDKSS